MAIAKSDGTIIEKRLFDAWGKLLSCKNGSDVELGKLTILDRGYTGHEHLQGVGLIHMNGRLYDPVTHRFLAPDNYVQDPYNTQNFNRYGYVLNNPLMYTDPSGESWWSKNWKSVVTVVAAVATGALIVASMGTATPFVAAAWAGLGAGFVGGALGTALNGGSFWQSVGAGIVGGSIGAVTGGLGAYASAAVGAVGVIPGAFSGASISVTLGAITNLVTGRDWDEGIGLNAAFGAFGGAMSGLDAAKKSGANIWTGVNKPTSPPPSVLSNSNTTDAGIKTNQAIDKAKETYKEMINDSFSIKGDNEIKLLNQYNSVEGLIEGAGNLERVKGGIKQGFVNGNGQDILKALTREGTLKSNGMYLLKDGTILGSHKSTTTKIFTIDIHKIDGKKFKIRIR